ncbi:MAG: segregation/condensation protein A [Pyramidobacter sp.]|nr:segregation/condensation protein A [Pyramidobacter sp.]
MFQVELDGFSGPLDLLCHMIDQKKIEVAQISVSEIISVYSAYLARSEKLSIASIAEFIAQAAHLVLQKTVSLLPAYEAPLPEDDIIPIDDEHADLREMLERYRPYRKAAEVLDGLKDAAEQRRFRPAGERVPYFDLGDLYSLSVQWLKLLNRCRQRAELFDPDPDDWEIDGVPPEIPDEVQVENRMERVLERLTVFPDGLSLRSMMKEEPGRGPLVVTLLALLELSRRNKVSLTQKELFGDVFICARSA